MNLRNAFIFISLLLNCVLEASSFSERLSLIKSQIARPDRVRERHFQWLESFWRMFPQNMKLQDSGSARHPVFEKSLDLFFSDQSEEQKKQVVSITSKMKLTWAELEQLMQSTMIDTRHAEKTKEARDLIVKSNLYILRNSFGNDVPKTRVPVTQVSTAGVNFAYPQQQSVRVIREKKQHVFDLVSDPAKMRQLSMDDVSSLYFAKWDALLGVLAEAGVEIVVLPAMGLGAFLPGSVQKNNMVREAVVQSLDKVLQKRREQFKAVFVSIPVRDVENYRVFQEVLKDQLQRKYEVVRSNIFDIAYLAAQEGLHAGLLNPSDVEALVSGNLGQYWYSGHMALEETFPYQTTLLLNNWAVTGTWPEGWAKMESLMSRKAKMKSFLLSQ